MADEVVDLLHINDITVMRTLDPEDVLADWEDMELLARILINNELLDETVTSLPIMYEGAGGRPAARWELGGLQIPTDCCLFTLIIMTTSRFEIFCFEFERGSDGIWDSGVKSEGISLRFRAQVFLHHPPSCFHREYHTSPTGIVRWDIPPAELWDVRLGFPHRILGSLPAEQLLHLAMQHYTQSSPGDNGLLKHALAAFEQALEDPNIDPGLSQVLETIIPFLHCYEQGYSSCLDIAFQVLQTFPGLPNAQLNAQFFLQLVVSSIVERFEWNDHIPLAIKLITGPLELLLHSTSPAIWKLFVVWVALAYHHGSDAKEVLPLMDLVVHIHSGFPTPEGMEFLPMMTATVYFKQAINPGGPSLGMTLGVAEFVIHSLAGRERSPHLGHTVGFKEFTQWSIAWLLRVLHQDLSELKPYKDRLLSFVAWQLNLPLHPKVHTLKEIQSRLRGNVHISDLAKVAMSRPPILDDNDKKCIDEFLYDLRRDVARGKEIPVEYPKGAAELARNLLIDADSGLPTAALSCQLGAVIARALRLPEAFKVYEAFMGCLGKDRLDALGLSISFHSLGGPSAVCSVIPDAISYASETGNYASALQWSDQGCSRIWNWLFHSRLSIGQSATEPAVARTLKARPPWIDSWGKRQRGEQNGYDPMADNKVYLSASGYNRVPGFERFLLPKTLAEITSLAEVLGGPIVYLNADRYSSQALAVLPGLDDVVHIPLPDLDDIPFLRAISVEFMKSPQNFLWEGSLMKGLWERKGFKVDPPTYQHTPSIGTRAVHLLAYLWGKIVKPVLDGLGIQHAQKATADMPRIWWCPSGPLIGLPIHAAGVYMDGLQGSVISDYVVSSYFPSASALAYATRPEGPSQKFSLLVIANPTGAGLLGTELELEKIEKHTQAATLLTQELTHAKVTVEAVKKGMENTTWAHFACHGVTNPSKPWESALILSNHTRLTLREISDMSLPHAEFAYLSACQTAKGVVQAPDQSAHLSTGMLACGYRSVIGTLWQISDEYAPFVADRVYAKMLEGGRPDYKRAACALHDAVQALRKEPGVSFNTWLPFIHIGV